MKYKGKKNHHYTFLHSNYTVIGIPQTEPTYYHFGLIDNTFLILNINIYNNVYDR